MADVLLNYGDLFDTPEKKQRAVNDLSALRAHPGWHLMEQILKLNIKRIEEDILSDDELEQSREKEMKRDRMIFTFIKDLPGAIQNDFLNPAESASITDDPYA